MKSFGFILGACAVLASGFAAQAGDLDTHYSGRVVSASPNISVKYQDGHILTFDVSNMTNASITNESYLKVARLMTPKAGSCGKMIGELASDYSVVFKTDENELVTLKFNASSPTAPVNIAGDCDGGISGNFNLYISDNAQLPLTTEMSNEPAGAPAADARYYGSVIEVSNKITVRGKDGLLRELDSSGLDNGAIYNDLNMVELSNGGIRTKCGDSLGKLVSDFIVTIRTKKGMVRTAALRANSAQANVDVYGACEGNTLTQLQLDLRNGAHLEIR